MKAIEAGRFWRHKKKAHLTVGLRLSHAGLHRLSPCCFPASSVLI